jgi:hypothetical protein
MGKRRKEQVGGNGGSEAPTLPSCLPSLFWATGPDNWGGGNPQPLCTGCGSEQQAWGQEEWEGQVTPKARPTHLSKLRACGDGAERKKSTW